MQAGRPRSNPTPPGNAAEVFRIFLRLGLTSFGGPVAHLGYFRAEFVQRRKWLDEGAFADIVALCQFLPGPASSQVGITLGILRAGLPGALAAWLGFTLPSAVAMILFGYGVTRFGNLSGAPWLHGLKIVAVAVVAQAVWGMARSLCPDPERATVAVGAAILALLVPSALGQVGAIAAGGLIGWGLLANAAPAEAGGSLKAAHLARAWSIAAGILFFGLLIGLPLVAAALPLQPVRLSIRIRLYRSGRPRRSAAAMSRLAPVAGLRSCRRAGCRTMRSSPAMARRKPCRGRFSRSRPISGTVMGPMPNGWGRRLCISASSRSSCRRSSS